jgi:NAD(P)-dependent dehydrogenase (short-subunit alcohol dehydrogenase family)
MTTSPANVDLSEQIALVTGGGRGLGRYIAQALARAGAAVAVVARSEGEIAETATLITQAGGRAAPFTADVTDFDAIQRAVSSIEQQLGAVDLLVNNAGRFHAPGPIWETDADDWWRDVEVNVRGPFLCAKAVLPGMMARQRGRMINLASQAGLWGIPAGSGYCSSKAALIRFSEILAADVKPYGISVFAVDPGTVQTPMNDYLLASQVIDKYVHGFIELFEQGRDVPPDLIANLTVRLASGQADALSGRFISVQDDLDDFIQRAEQVAKDDLYMLRLRQ